MKQENVWNSEKKNMLINCVILLFALIALVISADKFVQGASSIAKNFGVSPIIIGLTIVAMGSSAPEMMVSATAALQGKADTAIGNVLGSNITNIALILALTVLFKPIEVQSSLVKKEIPLLLAISIAAWFIFQNGEFSRLEGILLMVGFILFIAMLLRSALKQRKAGESDDPLINEVELELPETLSTNQAIFWLLFGMVLLPISANYLVDSAVFIAKYFGISDLVIGLTIIAIGTSLPELAASIASVIKKEDDLAIGNIVGSNIFNLLAVLALPGMIAPGMIDTAVISRDTPIMIFITLLLLLLCFSRRFGYFRITRIKGALLLFCFIGYQYLLFL
jgi:cation:H+ antiporter